MNEMTIWNELADNLLTWDTACFILNAGVFGFVNKIYNDRCRNYLAVFTARQLEINEDLGKTLLEEYPNGTCPHALIRGAVKATGQPLYSRMVRDEKGVALRFQTIDYRIKWNAFSRMWHHEQKVIQDSHQHSAFGLTAAGKLKARGFVDIPQPLQSVSNCLTKIYDKYTPTTGLSHLSGWLSGEHSEGVREKEYILREGAVILGYGTIKADSTGSVSLVQPPDGTPLILTGDSLSSLLKTLDGQRAYFRFWSFIFGITCLSFGAYLSFRLFTYYRRRQQGQADAVRRRRRQHVRSAADEGPQCIICVKNRVEVILLECGHLCLCVDCCEQLIDNNCPICQTPYTRQVAAYLP